MRSQTTKPLPKKGALNKTTFKATSSIKQGKRKSVSPKKVKNLISKSLITSPKKSTSKDDITSNKNDEETSGDKKDFLADISKSGSSKGNNTRSESPSKKNKKESKEKKTTSKNVSETNLKKMCKKPKSLKKTKGNAKPNSNNKEDEKEDSEDVKYKINSEVSKKISKVTKTKTIAKKGNIITNSNQKKKITKQIKDNSQEIERQDKDNKSDKNINNSPDNMERSSENNAANTKLRYDKSDDAKDEDKLQYNVTENPILDNIMSANHAETPKPENERPPKFFTSSRSPRTVDIDVKCCKNSKGNLSVSERFLSMKCETKNDEINKDKISSNALVSQGPEIDVYTFTEKVDSPKSILSDFRSPMNKNIGRVRPIARVKGTIIDKKSDSDKKKYSPHRPIEEVVKQLKSKRCEELNTNQNENNDASCSVDLSGINNDKELEDKPKPIISKSYKMVARKSSITGKPFSPIKFFDNDPSQSKNECHVVAKTNMTTKKTVKSKKQQKKSTLSDEELDHSKFSLNKTYHYTSSDESVSESNDDNDTKESSESDIPKGKKTKNKKYKRITDSVKKSTSKELRELSKDSLVDLKDDSLLLGNEKPSKRRLKLLSMWTGPKKHRMASLNAIAKVHCLYENESRTHMELGLMKTVDRQIVPSTSKLSTSKKKEAKLKETEKTESTSESEYENTAKEKKENESSDSSDDNPPQRSLRGVPGIRSAGKYWDPKSSSSSSEDSELEYKNNVISSEKKKTTPKTTKVNEISSVKSDSDKTPAKMKKTIGVPVKKKRNRNEVVMDLKDMVVQKRMASLNATAILAASYEKRSPKSNKDDTTSDSCSDDSFSQKSKNGVGSGVKSELRKEETKKESEDVANADRKQKVEVIVNQDTDVTITGVYSTHHHEGFCTVSGMQYRISSTSHTQTTATANCEKEGCTREDGARYTPLSALSSMQPPTEHTHSHPHPVPELGGLTRRAAGCSSAFSAPSPAAHHEPGYYQPAGPLIKESGADAERALARYHPPPHYHAPHPPVIQQYGPPYYPAELCYGRYYRPPGPYHMPPPQADPQMVGVGSDPYSPPQYYGTPPCYQHSPQRIPYVEYRGCSCPLNACPKNVLIGPATGKAPTSGGPDVPSALAHAGGAFRPKVRACALDAIADTHGSGKDPPLEPEPPAATDAPHPCPVPAIGGASPKRELYDVRDNLRMSGEMRGPVEAVGPPSPARGSAGACAPQPPPVAPRRARLGKAMARRSLVGDDTGLLLSVPQAQPTHHSDADDDVMAISPPACAPIDLSSSDERSTPLVDIKKENEGPTYSSPRKTDAQALREHNCTTMLSDGTETPETAKAVKRRYSKPKLEIDMKDVQLEDSCKTNGIGEHVKLQKRRKVSSEQIEVTRTETITKEPKKKLIPKMKRTPKSPTEKKSPLKRKLENASTGTKAKKMLLDATIDDEDQLLKTMTTVTDEATVTKPKNKSAVLLDNLIRKNSIDRKDSTEKEINPAELFLSPNENVSQNCGKKAFNINNNIVQNVSVNGVRPNTIAAVTQHLGKKLANKNAYSLEKVDPKITQSVLTPPTEKMTVNEDNKVFNKLESNIDSASILVLSDLKSKEFVTDKCETIKDNINNNISVSQKNNSDVCLKSFKVPKNAKANTKSEIKLPTEESHDINENKDETKNGADDRLKNRTEMILDKPKRCKLTDKTKGDGKGKSIEKVAKLLVSKKPAIKTDEANLLVEDACASPIPSAPKKVGRRARRRRSGALLSTRRQRRLPVPLAPLDYEPRTPRWNNGWKWDGEHYVSKVYLNNDSRLDRTARCWSQMTHNSGDQIARGDCVLLRASSARAQPFVARIARLWENPDDGEMMVSLVWYYRPEHTERGRAPADAPDEVFASRHRDANSVACIEDKCYVLTFNEYCRYRKRLKAQEEGITIAPSLVPPMPAAEVTPPIATNDSKLPLGISPELVLFCRKIYDFRSKKIQVPNK